jgi:hypothetical protein
MSFPNLSRILGPWFGSGTPTPPVGTPVIRVIASGSQAITGGGGNVQLGPYTLASNEHAFIFARRNGGAALNGPLGLVDVQDGGYLNRRIYQDATTGDNEVKGYIENKSNDAFNLFWAVYAISVPE